MKITTLWPTKGNHFCVVPNDFSRQPLASEYFLASPSLTSPPNAWSGSATGLLWCNHAFSHDWDDLRRTPEIAPSNPEGSIEPTLRTSDLWNWGCPRTSWTVLKFSGWTMFVNIEQLCDVCVIKSNRFTLQLKPEKQLFSHTWKDETRQLTQHSLKSGSMKYMIRKSIYFLQTSFVIFSVFLIRSTKVTYTENQDFCKKTDVHCTYQEPITSTWFTLFACTGTTLGFLETLISVSIMR